MKGIKRLSVLALSMVFAVGLASCGGGQGDNTTTSGVPTTTTTTGGTTTTEETNPYFDDSKTEIVNYEDKPTQQVIPEYVEFETLDLGIGTKTDIQTPGNTEVYINEQNKIQYRLEKITLYTNNVRTKFYLGEVFNYDGLLVLATFTKLNEDGTVKTDASGKAEQVLAKVTTYQVDSKAVDTNVMGTYQASVSYRYGENTKTANYTITVRSSEYETTKNLEYVAGLKVGYKADKVKTTLDAKSVNKVLQNDGRIYTRYINYIKSTNSFENDFELDIDQLDINIISNKVNGVASTFSQTIKPYDTTKLSNDKTAKKITSENGRLEIDYSSVDTGKAGSYLIKVKYTGVGFEINGVARENVVQAFVVVDVINPISGILQPSGKMEVKASLDGTVDLSKYTATVYRKFGDPEALPITPENFDISGVIAYKAGEQTATIKAKELSDTGQTYSKDVKVNVGESDVYDINMCTDLTGGTVDGLYLKEKSEGNTKGAAFFEKYTLPGNNIFSAYYLQVTASDGASMTASVDDITSDATNYLLAVKGTACDDDGLSFTGYGYLGKISDNQKKYLQFKFDRPGVLILYMGSGSSDERTFGLFDASESMIESYSVTKNKLPEKITINIDKAGTYKIAALGSTVTFHGFITAVEKE